MQSIVSVWWFWGVGLRIRESMGSPEDGPDVTMTGGIPDGKNELPEGPVVGPGPARPSRPKRPLEFEKAFLDAMPCAQM